jgi:hypothetical protein
MVVDVGAGVSPGLGATVVVGDGLPPMGATVVVGIGDRVVVGLREVVGVEKGVVVVGTGERVVVGDGAPPDPGATVVVGVPGSLGPATGPSTNV